MVRMSTSSSSSSKKVSDPSNMDKGRRGWNWTAVVTSEPDGGLTLKKVLKYYARVLPKDVVLYRLLQYLISLLAGFQDLINPNAPVGLD